METASLPAKPGVTKPGVAMPVKITTGLSGRRAPSLRVPLVAGLATIGIGLGSITAWAFTARLDSAAVAAGTVIVDSRRKTVSHLEGGILQRLLVEEGDVVSAGQSLLQLDTTRARSDMEQLRGRRAGLLARLARLRAEQSRAPEMQPDTASDDDTPVTVDAVRAERNLMLARRETYQRKLSIQLNQIEQQAAESEAAAAQIVANARQLELLRADLVSISGLVAKGFARRTQLTDLLTRESELIGRGAELVARKTRAEQAKAVAQIEILSLDTELQQQVAGDIQTTQLDLAEATQRLAAARDVLRRLEVVSPQAGVVANIRMRTPGSALAPGQPLLDIVPEREPFVIEAKVSVRDIDSIQNGAAVNVRLTAFNHRTLPPLPGRVTYVAADQQIDDRNGTAFFVVRAELSPVALAEYPALRLTAGMSADVLVIHEKRRAIDYFLAPFTESFDKAFRER